MSVDPPENSGVNEGRRAEELNLEEPEANEGQMEARARSSYWRVSKSRQKREKSANGLTGGVDERPNGVKVEA